MQIYTARFNLYESKMNKVNGKLHCSILSNDAVSRLLITVKLFTNS
jgi:hypothetical protein